LNHTLAYSPVSQAIRYKKVSFDNRLDTSSIDKGEPHPELDNVWKDIFLNANIRLSKDEMQKINKTAPVELYDGSGYYGQLSVYHHLHCLRYIRDILYPDYYNKRNTPNRNIQVDVSVHVKHCINDIRQALMCHADTSVVTFEWEPKYRKPWPVFSNDHTCVDWGALDNWSSKRSFSLFDQKSLVHPELGLAFPLIDGKIETIAQGPHMHIVWPEHKDKMS